MASNYGSLSEHNSNTTRNAMNAMPVIIGLLLTLSVACERSPGVSASRTATADSLVRAESPTTDISGNVPVDTMAGSRSDQAARVQTSDRDHDRPSEHFTVLSATSKRWVSGVASGGRGIDYSFRVQIKTAQPITFDTAWIGNRPYAIAVVKEVGRVSNQPVTISNGDSVVLRVSIMARNGGSASEEASLLDHAEQARILYHVNGKQFFLTVSQIQSTTGHNRP